MATHVSHFTWSSTIEDAVSESNSGDYLFCDESHKVSVDGSDAIYYALSKDEWTYLFNNHVNVWGQCNSVNGRFIAPDGFEGNESALASAVSNWATAEASGIVFLLAAGYRGGSDVCDVGGSGRYWSSSANDASSAYSVYFYSGNASPDDPDFHDIGYSVRLVTDAN